MQDLIQEEFKKEGEMLEIGSDRNERSKKFRKGIIFRTYIMPLFDSFKAWLTTPNPATAFGDLIPYFARLTDDELITLIYVALETVLNKGKSTRAGMIVKLGHTLLYQMGIFELNKKYDIIWEYSKNYKPHIIHRIFKENCKAFVSQFTKEEIFRVGWRFYLLLKEAGIIKETMIIQRKKIVYAVVNPEILKLLEKYDFIKPLYKPMVVPPIDWEIDEAGDVKAGGYYVTPLDFIHGQQKGQKLVDGIWLSSLNKLQKVPYRLSPEMIAFFEHCLNTEELVFPQPHEFRKPKKPENKDPDVQKIFKYKMREYYTNVLRAQGLWIAYQYTLKLAKEYKDYDKIYFPMFLDFRGRMYYAPAYIQPQTADYGKAMIEFAEPRKVETEEGWKWFKIAIANAYGYAKHTYKERLEWFKEHEDLIEEIGKSPYNYIYEIEQADEPFQFTHLCVEYVKAKKGEPVGVIIQIDGSNNGTQHLSALEGYNNKYVNMTSEDHFYDLYQEIADKVNKLVDEDKDIHNLKYKMFWQRTEKRVNRSFVKRNVMTYPYSVTFPGMVDQNLQYVIKEYGLGFFEDLPVYATILYITQKIYQALQETVPVSVLQWLKNVVNKVNQPLEWVTPSGFHVNQAYWKQYRKQLKTTFGKRSLRLRFKKDTSKLLKRKMKLAISPNFVHSYDAAHLALIADRFNDLLLVQHDSFATYPDKIEELQRIIRETFVEIYSEPILEKQRHFWERKYKVELPPPPYRNEFDPEEILKAPYFFS